MTAKTTNTCPLVWDQLGIFSEWHGIGQYARQLLPGLVSSGWSPQLFDGNSYQEILGIGLDGDRVVPSDLAPRPNRDFNFYAQTKFPRPQLQPLLAEPGSIIHGLANINSLLIPIRKDIKTVITIHDLIPLLTPVSRYGLLVRLTFRAISISVDRIVVVSQWTKKHLAKEGIPEEKISVIPNGFPPSRFHVRNHSGHLLCVSRYEKYKNLEFFGKILAHTGLKGTLVTDKCGLEVIGHKFSSLIAAGQLHLKHSISGPELDELYGAASVYLHPSSYEGFCLPAAEANARGLPVVFKSGSGIDETVKWGIGVEDFELSQWAQAIASLNNEEIPVGLKDSVNCQSWLKSSLMLAKLYDELRSEL